MRGSKTDRIRFNVLKLLKEQPTHGYDLFLILKEDDFINQASDLYRVIRRMKKNGLIEEETIDSDIGPNKKILHLTQEGIEEYYDWLIDSAELFFGILLDVMIERFSPPWRALKDANISQDFLKNKVVYFSAPYINVRLLAGLIKKFFADVDVEFKLVIKLNSEISRVPFRSLENAQFDLRIIDELVAVRKNSIDLYIFIPFIPILDKGESPRSFLQQHLNSLKDDGTFLIWLWRGSERGQQQPPPKIFQNLMRDVFQGVPENQKKRLQQIFLPIPKNFTKSQRITAESMKTVLSRRFESVQEIELGERGSLIIARTPFSINSD